MCQFCGLSILVFDNDQNFIKKITQALLKLSIFVESSSVLPENLSYDFYVMGGETDFCKTMELVRSKDKTGKIFLSGSSCEQKISAKKLIKYEIEACIDKNDSGVSELLKCISTACKARKRISDAGKKLDRIKKEVLKSSSSTSRLHLLH